MASIDTATMATTRFLVNLGIAFPPEESSSQDVGFASAPLPSQWRPGRPVDHRSPPSPILVAGTPRTMSHPQPPPPSDERLTLVGGTDDMRRPLGQARSRMLGTP